VRSVSKTVGVASGYIAQADIVLEYASDLVPGILAGTTPLNEAYEEAQSRKAAADSEEGKMNRIHKIKDLRESFWSVLTQTSRWRCWPVSLSSMITVT
jgi:hypothetical protein